MADTYTPIVAFGPYIWSDLQPDAGFSSRTIALSFGPILSLSATQVIESAPIGTTIGVFSVVNHPSGPAGWTFTETADPDNKFAVSGADFNTSALLDYDSQPSHSVTITATKPGQTDIVQVFSITVLNVLEVTLAALALSDLDWLLGSPDSGIITGKTGGSTVTVVGSLPSGLSLDLVAMTWSWDGTGLEGSGTFTLRETHPDGSNSPRDSGQSYTITDAVTSSISAPKLSFADLLAYPPVPTFCVDETAHKWEDSIQVQISLTDSEFLAPEYDNLFPLSVAGPWTLSTLLEDADEPFWRARIVRRPGEPDEEVSEWCTTIQTGATTTLAITSDLAPSFAEGTTNATYTPTADGPVKAWHVEGPHVHLVDFDGSTITILESPLNYEHRFLYSLVLRAESLTGDYTWEDLVLRVSNIDEPLLETIWSTNYCYAPLVRSNSDKTLTALSANDGQHRKAISTQKRSGDRYFEILYGTQASTNYQWIGVTNNQENLAFQDGGTPGIGTALFTSNGTAYSGVTGASVGTNASYAFVENDVGCFQVSTTHGKLFRKKNDGPWDGDPLTGTGGVALPVGMTDYHIYAGLYRVLGGISNVITLRTLASEFSYSPSSGYVAFDS